MANIQTFKERMAEGKKKKAEEKAIQEESEVGSEEVEKKQKAEIISPTLEQPTTKLSEEDEQLMKMEAIKNELVRDEGTYRLAVLDRLEAIHEVETNILAEMKKLNGDDDD